jgi:SPP1 family predicted phage head-tail adaptor
MNAGSLRRWVEFQARDAGLDAFGQPPQTWNTFYACWGEVKDLSMREMIAAQAINSEVSTRIKIRYHAGIEGKHRAVCGGVIYNLMPPIDPDGRKIELHIGCSRGLNQG